jgi:hypothetical protein
MKFVNLKLVMALVVATGIQSCSEDDDTSSTNTGNTSNNTITTPTAALDEFDTGNVSYSFSGNQLVIQANGLPNHTSNYWSSSATLYDANDPCMTSAMPTPHEIESTAMDYTLTVNATPVIASNTTSTGLGAIGIAVSGAPIYNENEGNNQALDATMATTLDCAGAHGGPTGYHYHTESRAAGYISFDDEKLVGIMMDGFLLYGRKCSSAGGYPSDLDASGGHSSSTQHSSESYYHYHILNSPLVSDYYALFAEDLKGEVGSF